jgi:hypothetical protein
MSQGRMAGPASAPLEPELLPEPELLDPELLDPELLDPELLDPELLLVDPDVPLELPLVDPDVPLELLLAAPLEPAPLRLESALASGPPRPPSPLPLLDPAPLDAPLPSALSVGGEVPGAGSELLQPIETLTHAAKLVAWTHRCTRFMPCLPCRPLRQ